jgi:hypothetical protein
VPFSFWYYSFRQDRFDYPPWSDAILIPIFQESVSWIAGAVVTSVTLYLLLRGRALPDRITWSMPNSRREWIRAAFLGCWIALLCQSILFGIPDGDEGAELTSVIAVVVLVVVASAQRIVGDCGGNSNVIPNRDLREVA